VGTTSTTRVRKRIWRPAGSTRCARSTGRRSTTIPAFPATGITASAAGALLPELASRRDHRRLRPDGCRYQRDTYSAPGRWVRRPDLPDSWYGVRLGGTGFTFFDGAGATRTGLTWATGRRISTVVAGCAICGAELTWLTNDLASHPRRTGCLLALPPVRRQHSQGSDWFLDGPENLEGVLASYGVNIVFMATLTSTSGTIADSRQPDVDYVTGGGASAGGVSGHSSFARTRSPSTTISGSRSRVVGTVTRRMENGATFDVQTTAFLRRRQPRLLDQRQPAILNVIQGQGGTSTSARRWSVARRRTVTLSASGLPAGATAHVQSDRVHPGAARL